MTSLYHSDTFRSFLFDRLSRSFRLPSVTAVSLSAVHFIVSGLVNGPVLNGISQRPAPRLALRACIVLEVKSFEVCPTYLLTPPQNQISGKKWPLLCESRQVPDQSGVNSQSRKHILNLNDDTSTVSILCSSAPEGRSHQEAKEAVRSFKCSTEDFVFVSANCVQPQDVSTASGHTDKVSCFMLSLPICVACGSQYDEQPNNDNPDCCKICDVRRVFRPKPNAHSAEIHDRILANLYPQKDRLGQT